MNISAKEIAKLRMKTGLGMMECKKALVEAKGSEEEAIKILKRKGLSKAEKKSERETKSGLIDSYIHDGRIGVMVEVATETDFVAKNDEFKKFVHDLTLHIASARPKYVSKEEIPSGELDGIRKELSDEIESEKPKNIKEKILEGKLEKYLKEKCLLNQPFIKDEDKTISDLLTELIAKIGENIKISRFIRYELGE